MIKNYTTHFLVILLSFILFPVQSDVRAQEPRIFSIADFELRGKVKTCLVITDYGKEEFEFNEAGLLTKSVTRFNDNDYDITYYKYDGEELSERRNESYRDGVFDKGTSIAHLYTIDTTANKKITEKILSYNNEFLDQYEYIFNEEKQLVLIKRSNNEGLDETEITYSQYKGELTTSFLLNGTLQKSIRTSYKKKRNGDKQKIVLTKEFLEGEPKNAEEAVYGQEGSLISIQKFNYSSEEKSFVPAERLLYKYEEGMLSEVITKSENEESTQKYVYQFDQEEDGNWIKKIITPENEYTTRKITYFEEEEAVEENKG